MRVLSLDIGDKRVGVAYGESTAKIASPVCVVGLSDIMQKSKNFITVIEDYMPEFFVFGLPKSLDGQENKQALHIKDKACQISDLYNLPYDFIDERLSSKEAKNFLREQGLTEKQMRGKIDSVAASLFLETWFKMNEGKHNE